MSLVLYYGSGSPWAWRAQLALEHKALPYERKVLSFSAGDTLKPEFVALNPRHRVPVLVDGDFVLYESNAIVEYLDEAYPGRGAPLFPGDARTRAHVRRLIDEVDNYFDKAVDPVIEQAFYTKPEERDAKKLEAARDGVIAEYAMFTKAMDKVVVAVANLVEKRLKEAKDEVTKGQAEIKSFETTPVQEQYLLCGWRSGAFGYTTIST